MLFSVISDKMCVYNLCPIPNSQQCAKRGSCEHPFSSGTFHIEIFNKPQALSCRKSNSNLEPSFVFLFCFIIIVYCIFYYRFYFILCLYYTFYCFIMCFNYFIVLCFIFVLSRFYYYYICVLLLLIIKYFY